jgi:hypothetical protein
MIRLLTIVPYRMILAVVIGVDIVIALGLAMMLNADGAADPGLMKGISIGIPVAVLLMVIALVTVLLRPWLYLSDIDAMRKGGAWAHWSYDAAGWRTANRVEGVRTGKTGFTGALMALGLAVVVLLIGLAIDGEDRSAFLFAGGVVGGGAIAASAAFGGTSPALLARRRKQGDIYISRLGIYRDPGGYTPMFGFGFRLANVVLHTEPTPYLSFEASVQGRYSATLQSLADVAVPPGREAEARDLVTRLRTEVLGRAPA